MEKIGTRIKQLRNSEGLTQEEFANLFGVSRVWITNIENGKRKPNELLVKMISAHFVITESWLLTGKPPQRPSVPSVLNSDFVDIVESLNTLLVPSKFIPTDFILSLKDKYFGKTINYLCNRIREATDSYESKRIFALMPVAFPDFERTLSELYSKTAKEIFTAQQTSVLPAGKVAAGASIFDNGAEEITVELPIRYLDSEHFPSFEVQGDSMEPHLHSGDIVFVERNVRPLSGQIAVVHIIDGKLNEGYLIKKFYEEHNGIKLVSCNPDYPPKFFKKDEIVDAQVVVYEVHK